jgi:hypothetical protein
MPKDLNELITYNYDDIVLEEFQLQNFLHGIWMVYNKESEWYITRNLNGI